IAPSDPDAVRGFRIGSVLGRAGSEVQVPIESDLAGGEITTQFTIHFDPSTLSISNVAGANLNADILPGDLPNGAHVIVNTSRIKDGYIGIVIDFNGSGAYPPTTAASGTARLVLLRFRLDRSARFGEVVPLTFSDDVFLTKASDSLGQSLSMDGG